MGEWWRSWTASKGCKAVVLQHETHSCDRLARCWWASPGIYWRTTPCRDHSFAVFHSNLPTIFTAVSNKQPSQQRNPMPSFALTAESWRRQMKCFAANQTFTISNKSGPLPITEGVRYPQR